MFCSHSFCSSESPCLLLTNEKSARIKLSNVCKDQQNHLCKVETFPCHSSLKTGNSRASFASFAGGAEAAGGDVWVDEASGRRGVLPHLHGDGRRRGRAAARVHPARRAAHGAPHVRALRLPQGSARIQVAVVAGPDRAHERQARFH